MDFSSGSVLDLAGLFVGFVFTLMVFSYILGDNLLFRIAIYVFIGVAAGYAAIIAIYSVILPQLIRPLISGNMVELQIAIPLLLFSLLLVGKLSPRFTSLGTPVMAYLVGVGAAAAIGGAVLGTLFPQVLATINLFDLQAIQQRGGNIATQLLTAGFALFGTLTTLIYFHFSAPSGQGKHGKRAPWIEVLAWIGQIFIAVTFGVLFAGVFSAALIALIERVDFVVNFIRMLIFP